MRLLVFCGTHTAIQRFAADSDWRVITTLHRLDQRGEILDWFRKTEGAKLAVDQSMMHGWRAPDYTMVLFHPSWPYHRNDPESLQAVARVREFAETN